MSVKSFRVELPKMADNADSVVVSIPRTTVSTDAALIRLLASELMSIRYTSQQTLYTENIDYAECYVQYMRHIHSTRVEHCTVPWMKHGTVLN